MLRADELRALLKRVEEATEGGHDLDEAIHAALLPDDPWWLSILEGRRLVAAGDPEAYVICPPTGPLGGENRMRAASWAEGAKVGSYTTSVDAAFALIRKVLPDAYLDMDGTLGKANWCVTIRIGDHDAGEAWTRPAPALALCAALLSALIAKEVENGR